MDSIDSLNHLEEQFFDAGYQVGIKDGKQAGKLEGYQLGSKEGYNLWEELGYYLGQCQVWGAALRNSEKLNSKIQSLISQIEVFPIQNSPASQQTDLITQLNNIRATYRLCWANMGLRPRIRQTGDTSL